MKNLHIYLRLFIFTFLMILGACQSDVAPVSPPLPDLFADISGFDSLRYSAPSYISHEVDSSFFGELIFSKYIDSTKKEYYLGFYIYYKDKAEKTGIFPFKSKKDTSFGDFAFGYFQIGLTNKRYFITDSGSVTIEIASKTQLKGTFNFLAKEYGTNEIINVRNGAFNIQ